MAEIPVVALDFHWQKQAEAARTAFECGRFESAIERASGVLVKFPACLAMRKLLHAAQVKAGAEQKSGLFGRLVGSVSAAPFMMSASAKLQEDPLSTVATADKLLLKDPHNVAALALLGEAASALGWNETAVFAFERALEHEPDRPDLLLGLGPALLAVGRVSQAHVVARNVLQLQPNNPEAKALAQNVAIAMDVAARKVAEEARPRPPVPSDVTKTWKKPGT